MSDEHLKIEPEPSKGTADKEPTPRRNQWQRVWENLSQAGLGETVLRLGTHVLLVAFILIVAWGLRTIYLKAQAAGAPRSAAFAAPVSTTATLTDVPVVDLPEFHPAIDTSSNGISRNAQLHTDVPSRPRMEVIKYTVQPGDTVFGIAEKFGLKPETILWANQATLGDNPHSLRPEQVLNILPVNGTYHRWSAGDGLNAVAKFFGVKPEDIINFPGNNMSMETIGDLAHPNIEAGTWLVVPNGHREFVNWSMPTIPLDNPGVAKVLGPGACSAVANGAVGAGVFIWPANHHFLSGFDYSPGANHSGIDVDGETGDPVYAVDNGVVVYAGWNNWGYGNMVVINHGNGWQTLYAHLSAYNVQCGQSIYQTNVIGAIGSTGNSTGSHLHFEMMYNGTKVNPHDYLP
jgi:murein DD-endopeptidase MepM/ murein hydrolase activator NlpD